ncbi:DegT/DnrJ/EryC1/StrS family aminotransferase [Muricoccus nepalensis]|uniref:DegT/DnrJ/EryC1/StrS family aminotransferase n=1 Tax=Muricoccus nepalensis TaxID=1854500 RepID=UPI001F4F26A6|nr:DegT/DnrJ/EryC1/StrS family aminotransferase [Roseomonas nepalensis]
MPVCRAPASRSAPRSAKPLGPSPAPVQRPGRRFRRAPRRAVAGAGRGAVQEYPGRGGAKAGHGARLACFSFNGNKIITAGGGGALVSDNPALIATARHLSTQAKETAPHYQHETTGYSYGLSSVLAAVGLAQLRTLEARVASRRAVFARYVVGLADVPGVSFMPEPAWGRSSRWLSVAMFDPARFGADREGVRRALDEAGIESRPVWKPLHLQPAFRDAEVVGGPVAASLFERGLCLPSGNMTPAVQARVIETIRRLARR